MVGSTLSSSSDDATVGRAGRREEEHEAPRRRTPAPADHEPAEFDSRPALTGPENAAAVERGEAVSRKRWDPIGVDHRGWLIARVRDRESGEVEGVYRQGSSWLFYGLGRRKDGSFIVHEVKNRELRRVVTAMIGGPLDSLADLYRERHAAAKAAARHGTGNVRRRVG